MEKICSELISQKPESLLKLITLTLWPLLKKILILWLPKNLLLIQTYSDPVEIKICRKKKMVKELMKKI
jgi:hypothetical protein